VIGRLTALMKYDTAGDPITGVKWSRRTMAKIAAELKTVGIDMSPNTVAKLLSAAPFRRPHSFCVLLLIGARMAI